MGTGLIKCPLQAAHDRVGTLDPLGRHAERRTESHPIDARVGEVGQRQGLRAGLVVFPLIFALGLSADVSESTVGALFITLPKAFAMMGVTGHVVGCLFFVALVVGALTSAISLLEVVVASAMDTLGWARLRSTLVFGVVIALLGIPAALNINILDWMDKLAGQLFLVAGGLLLAIFVGWVMKDPFSEVRKGAERVAWLPLWRFLLRYPIPLVLAVVLYVSVRKLFLN